MNKKFKRLLFITIFIICIIILSGCTVSPDEAFAAGNAGASPSPSVAPGTGPLGQLLGSRNQALQLIGILTVLSLAPSILIMLTGFVRIIIVLSFTRQALGLQQTPPNQVIVVLAMFLTLFVMSPVLNQIKTDALDPYLNNQITFQQAIDNGEVPLRSFMLRQTFKTDLNMFLNYSNTNSAQLNSVDDIPMTTVVPAFLTSEIKRAFTIGFLIYIPFIVIDMVVASILMAMGMMMLPPVTISLPFKVLLFVLVDGWTLTIESLITSFS